MHLLWRDLRFGARLLWKAPGFSAVALVALALGMGATTAIFSVVDAVLLKPLPFRDPGRVLVIWEKNPAQNKYKLPVAPANFYVWQKQSRTIDQMAALQDTTLNLTGGPNGHIEPEEIKVERVSASLFPMLGVQPLLGRTFRADEDQPGRNFAVVLSHSLWQRRFGGDPAIVGKSIRLRDQLYEVAGVLPHGFLVMQPGIDIWLPIGLNPSDPRQAERRYLTVIARRKDSLEAVRAEFDTIGQSLVAAAPALNKGWAPSFFVLQDELIGGVQRALWVLLGAVGCLLLMSCVNVANLLLARGASRRREIALRAALGAGRGRIASQMLAESMLLALGGGALGFLLAAGVIRALAHSGVAGIPRLAQATIDVRLFLFALAVSLFTGLLFGSIPAFQNSGASLTAALNEGGRGGTMGRAGRAARNVLVVSEVALAVVVLIGAGLLIRSFMRMRAADLGFQPSGVLTLRVSLSGSRNADSEHRIAFFQQLIDRVSGLPAVRSAGLISGLPLTGLGAGLPFVVEGQPRPVDSQWPMALFRSVTPAYFHTIGIPLEAGRAFADSDNARAPYVVLVNRTLVRRLPAGVNPLGSRLTIDNFKPRVAEIIGVVGDVKADRIDGEDWPTIYAVYPQYPSLSANVVMRTAASPLGLAAAVQREVYSLDPDQPVTDVRTMEEVVGEAISGARFNTWILGAFAFIAFTLAAVGIYGVISYDVNERINEIGIRMALGAQPRDLLRMVLGQGARMAAYGIGLGLLLSFALTRLMSSMLFGIKPTDIYTFALIAILLATVALAASYLPSRRAMAMNPLSALRHE